MFGNIFGTSVLLLSSQIVNKKSGNPSNGFTVTGEGKSVKRWIFVADLLSDIFFI